MHPRQLAALLIFLFAGGLFAQDPLTTLPQNYHLVLENPQVRVIDVKYAAQEKLPVHDHPVTPTIYVYLTDGGPVRFRHVEGSTFTVVRGPVTAGTFRLSPGRLEKHAVENLTAVPSEFLRVELKKVPLGFQHHDFRSDKPFDVTHSSIATEFDGPFVKIERVIGAGRCSTSTVISGGYADYSQPNVLTYQVKQTTAPGSASPSGVYGLSILNFTTKLIGVATLQGHATLQ